MSLLDFGPLRKHNGIRHVHKTGSAQLICTITWQSGRTSVFGRQTFPVLCSTCSWCVMTYVGKLYAIGQPTRPTQPFIPSGTIWLVCCNWMSSTWVRGGAIWWTLTEERHLYKYSSFSFLSLPEEDWAMATGSNREFEHFWDMWAKRHTDTLIAIPHPPNGD